MSDLSVIVVVAVIAVIAVVAAVLVNRRTPGREASDGVQAVGATPALMDDSEASGRGNEPDDEVLVMSTDRPNEVYLFGPASQLDELGDAVAIAPRQLVRYAAGLHAGTGAARSYAELSGRLVLVDEKTAAALKSGRMMRDGSGEILAKVLREDGKISSVTRIREVGGLAAGAASLTSAISAMAMQAQLDRIERQLSVMADGIDTANREILREWHAQTLGAQDVLGEVYRTSHRTGELTSSNWSQVASIGHVVRSQINGDRDRLVAAVADLERLAQARNVKQRMADLGPKVDALLSAHAALSESTRAWAQFSTLRLWNLTVSGDPTLEAYRHELQVFLESLPEDLEPLRGRTSEALRKVSSARWTARVRHPRVARRLPEASTTMLTTVENVIWLPLELRSGDDVETDERGGQGATEVESDDEVEIHAEAGDEA